LPNFAKSAYACDMGTMNISLPDALKDFVDEQVKRGYGAQNGCGAPIQARLR